MGPRNPLAARSASATTFVVAAVSVLAMSNAQIRRESTARAAALEQKDAALTTARDAVNQMLTDVASEKFNDVPIAHPLRLSLLKGAQRFYEELIQFNRGGQVARTGNGEVLYNLGGLQRELGQNEDVSAFFAAGNRVFIGNG